jgi:hypothetical protein
MKRVILTAVPLLLNACAYNSTMGVNDRFQVASTASFFAPSVTTVIDTQNPNALPPTFAGPSIVGQVANAAGTVAAGAFIGNGLSKNHGTSVNQSGGGAVATAKGGSSSALGVGGQGGAGGNGGNALSEAYSNSHSSVRSNMESVNTNINANENINSSSSSSPPTQSGNGEGHSSDN